MSYILTAVILGLPPTAMLLGAIATDGRLMVLNIAGLAAYLMLIALIGVAFGRLAGQGGTGVPE